MDADKENESSQKERYEKARNQEKMQDLRKTIEEKHGFWPASAKVKHALLWTVVGLTALRVVNEEAAPRL